MQIDYSHKFRICGTFSCIENYKSDEFANFLNCVEN
jgi:hypothetical protein